MKSNEVAEAVKKFKAAQADIENCQQSIKQLQIKCDELQESLPSLTRSIESAEKAKVSALDNYALHGSRESENELKQSRSVYEHAVKQKADTNELIEATHRALKRQEQELIKLNNVADCARRDVWTAVADEIEKTIPAETIEAVQKLIICRTQTGGTRQHVLNTLLPQLNPGDYQGIRDELMEKFGLED